MNTITPTSLYKKIAFVYQTTIKESVIEERKELVDLKQTVKGTFNPGVRNEVKIDIKDHKVSSWLMVE
jgi:hypothetical protein